MKRHLLKLTLFAFIISGLYSCEWEGYKPSAEEINDVSTEIEVLRLRDIPEEAGLFNIANTLRNDIGIWGYETGYTFLKGEEHRDSLELDIEVEKKNDRIKFDVLVNVSRFGAFPETWNSSFGHYEVADHLRMDLTLKNNRNNNKIKISEDNSISSNGNVQFEFTVYPWQLRNIESGMTDFTISIQTEFVSFFDYGTGKHPVSASISLPYLNPQFYHTKLYFKSITLNKDVTDNILGGDNDWNDSRPETSLSIRYEGQSLFYGHSSNNYEYAHAESSDIYHLDTNMMIELNAVDLDYGFNGNDYICDTLVPIRSLEGTDYHKLKMRCVNELLIYTEFKGKAN